MHSFFCCSDLGRDKNEMFLDSLRVAALLPLYSREVSEP